MSSASTAGSSATDGFERVTVDGTEYLAHDVVAQKEGVYTYPDPRGGVRREFVSADELRKSAEAVDQEDLLLSHPTTGDGALTLTTDPRANFDVVGFWRPDPIDAGIGGRVFIESSQVGEHDGALMRYLSQVRNNGFGEVSTGYDIERAVPDPGRFNEQKYGYTQQGVRLDHLALLPFEQGDCSVEDGCGLGRANEFKESLVRGNHHHPGSDDARQTPAYVQSAEALGELDEETRVNVLQELGKDLARRLGLRWLIERSHATHSVHEPTYSGTTETKWSKPSLEDFVDESWDELSNDQKSTIASRFLVSKSGFPPDNFGDLALPVVEPDGQLNLNGVESALKQASQVEGLSGEKLSRVESILERLLPEDRQNQMDDEEKINQLVEEYGLTRENIAHLEGTQCLGRIHGALVEQEGTSESNMGDNPGDDPGDDPGSGDGGDDPVFSEEQEQRIQEMVDEAAPEVDVDDLADQLSDQLPSVDGADVDEDELVDKAAEKAAEQAEAARAHEKNVQLIAESDELPHIDQDRAERMNEEVVAELAEDLDGDDGGDDGSTTRGNRAGIPTGGGFDASQYDTEAEDDFDVPVAGAGAPGRTNQEDTETDD